MILAGDIGGTKTNLALYEWVNERVEPVRLETFHSADYKSLEEILEEFLTPPQPPTPLDELDTDTADESEDKEAMLPPEPITLTAACFGIPGPVIDNHSKTTNLPWVVDGPTIATQFGIPRVQLLNDLEATAYGVLMLRPDEVEVLNPGMMTPPAPCTGSPMKAATLSTPISLIFFSSSPATFSPNSSGCRPWPNSNQ